MVMTCQKRSRIACSGTRQRAEEQKQEQPAEELQRGKVVAIHRIYEEQHLA